MFKIELKKALTRGSFKIAIFIGLVFNLLYQFLYRLKIPHNYLEEYYKMSVSSVYNNFIFFNLTSISNIYYIMLPLIAGIVYCDSYIEDKKSGYIKFVFIRKEKVNYFISKFLSNFISTGIAVSLPLLIGFLINLLTYPSVPTHASLGITTIMSGGLFASLFYKHPFIYTILWILIYFVYAGIFATAGLTFSIFVENKFIVSIFPFVLWVAIEVVCEIFDKGLYSPYQFLFLSRAQMFNVIAGEAIICIFISILIILIGGLRSEIY